MNNTRYDDYEKIIKQNLSYLDDLKSMKTKGDFWPAVVIGSTGFLIILMSCMVKINLVFSSIILFVGVLFLSLGLIIRKQIQLSDKIRERMFFGIWDRGIYSIAAFLN